MAIEVKEIVEHWTVDEPILRKTGTVLCNLLKSKLAEKGIMPEITFRTKELHSIIKKIKKKQIEKNDYSYDSLKDKLGLRVICVFEFELHLIEEVIKDLLDVRGIEYKKESLEYHELGYQSNHYDVCIDLSKIPELQSNSIKENLVFEIQVRTLNQHAWSNAAHQLSYKQEVDLPKEMKHRLYRLLSLYELADQEIGIINDYIKSQYNCMPMNGILQKIEGKFYKYGKIDYDRELSSDNLNRFVKIFTPEQVARISSDIERFIDVNSSKIEFIFTSNSNRYHEVLTLTQPEIFIAWYTLEEFEYTILNDWNNHFDYNELDEITTLWGKTID